MFYGTMVKACIGLKCYNGISYVECSNTMEDL